MHWVRFSVLAILLFFALPTYACGCSRISWIKANMHTLQTMLEHYHQTHEQYPMSLSQLKYAAQTASEPYWKPQTNPYSHRSDNAFTDPVMMADHQHRLQSFLGLPYSWKPVITSWRGSVVYQPFSPHSYRIYGLDLKEKPIKDKGQQFELSNH